uniref:Uncharacterized protein n=1 Tax=Oryza barthii TaxID=65489 RepID=A0A0D3HHB9_9ORYZ
MTAAGLARLSSSSSSDGERTPTPTPTTATTTIRTGTYFCSLLFFLLTDVKMRLFICFNLLVQVRLKH